MLISAKTDIGRVRKTNQDNYFIPDDESIPLFIIADGMGGHKAGEVASKMAIEIVEREFTRNIKKNMDKTEIQKIIKSAIELANTNIYLKSQNESFEGMGTTLTLCYLSGKEILIGHVGDSRVYILRDKLYQITEDHSYVNELLKSGNITEEEAKNHPKKNIITRALGTSSILEVDLYSFKAESSDIILMMTDGVFNMINEEKIMMFFKENSDINQASNEIISEVNKSGGLDNSTIISIKLLEEVKE